MTTIHVIEPTARVYDMIEAIVARCTQPAAPWTMPPGVKIARRTFFESTGTPLGVALFGAVARLIAPFVVLGGILWSPVAAVWHVLKKARRKR